MPCSQCTHQNASPLLGTKLAQGSAETGCAWPNFVAYPFVRRWCTLSDNEVMLALHEACVMSTSALGYLKQLLQTPSGSGLRYIPNISRGCTKQQMEATVGRHGRAMVYPEHNYDSVTRSVSRNIILDLPFPVRHRSLCLSNPTTQRRSQEAESLRSIQRAKGRLTGHIRLRRVN